MLYSRVVWAGRVGRVCGTAGEAGRGYRIIFTSHFYFRVSVYSRNKEMKYKALLNNTQIVKHKAGTTVDPERVKPF